MKKKILICVVILFTICIAALSTTVEEAEWKEGDIIFQVSQSKQAPFVQYATMSPWSHCGIVIEKNNKFYVLEASSTVKLTPIVDWVNRGRGKLCITRRVFKEPVKIKYSKYLGQSYDLAFKFNNGKMYCSELVYEIYKNQFGIELCAPKPLSKYHTLGLGKMMKKRHIEKTQLFVAPSDLLTYKNYV